MSFYILCIFFSMHNSEPDYNIVLPCDQAVMRVRLGTIIWALLVLGGASLVGQVVRVLSVDVTDLPPTPDDTTTNTQHDANSFSDTTLGADDDNLVWFMQVRIESGKL